MSRLHLIVLSVLLSVFSCANAQTQEETTTTNTINAQGNQEKTVTTTTVQPSADGTTTKTVETRHTVITTVPVADEVIAAPQGYITCTVIDAGWYNNAWIPAHKVCKYENSSEGVAWIEGYWKCNKATAAGACVIWEWQAGRWEKTYTTY